MHLKERVIRMATLAEAMIEHSVRGLKERQTDILRQVIDVEEPQLNALEMEVEELCTRIIALYEPKARDLRQILAAVRMSIDLERIGDHAVNIAQSSLFLVERPEVKPLEDTPRMADLSIAMMRDSVDAFIRGDAELARDVLGRDDAVDALCAKIVRDLLPLMATDAAVIERAMKLVRVVQNLERIADLSTNICEQVIYLEEGHNVKHHHVDDGPATEGPGGRVS
ncbi:MAG: phosphate signaling complex protein PhoU [Acidobacteria bacterium]|nr:phosphate signaling complex protein PhoU [Acidobacteriota bacterium]